MLHSKPYTLRKPLGVKGLLVLRAMNQLALGLGSTGLGALGAFGGFGVLGAHGYFTSSKTRTLQETCGFKPESEIPRSKSVNPKTNMNVGLRA